LVVRKRKRLQAKYGDDPFPEHIQLIEAIEDAATDRREYNFYMKGFRELVEEETRHLICAELEKIIWGKARPRTAAAIKEVAHRIEELIEAAEAKKKNQESEERRRNIEFLNGNRVLSGLPPLSEENIESTGPNG